MSNVWFERRFTFDAPLEAFPGILARIEATAGNIERGVQGLPREALTRRDGDKWSIQEQIGHLLNLEELHIERLDDYEKGVNILRPADLENKKTWQANHNARHVGELIADFRRERQAFIDRLRAYPRSFLATSAVHPRLQQPMRLIDMAVFVAEHDEHHLEKIKELAAKFTAGRSPR
ncbi:MAG: DinB family protein [Acidobacteriales bacterium]|nr:DinB family protein [Terriglobales bacterium]